MRSLAVAALACVLLAVVGSTHAASDQCTGTPNPYPMYTGNPVLLNQSSNGYKYIVGPDTLDPKLNLLHVYGTPYEMGYAYGELMAEEMKVLYPQAYEFMYSELGSVLKSLPASWQHIIEKVGIQVALDLTYDATKKYIPARFTEEIQGIAAGSGIPFQTIMNLALFPELIKAACSMFGAWGPATASSRDGALVQLRALDWSTNGPFQQFPMVIVYHPSDEGHAFSVLSWAGMVGSITGYSSAEVGICEKVWADYKGKYSVTGIPWTFLLRDILQFDTTIEAAEQRLENAHRTCAIYVGIGDAKVPNFNLVDFSYPNITVYNDTDFPAYPPYHDLYDGLLFYDKHEQPSHNLCLNTLLKENYGNIEPAVTYQNITAVFQTGDMHIAIYDFAMGTMSVANAGVYNNVTGAEPAYNRQFVQLNMTEAFALPKPSSV